MLERGTASDYFSSDYAPWAKTRTKPMEKRIFELGTPGETVHWFREVYG